MAVNKHTGACRCGDIKVAVEIAASSNTLNPRACDCEFCRKRGASYLSDPEGKLIVAVENDGGLIRHRMDGGTADFLICKNCETLAAVCYKDETKTYGAVNSGILAGATFGEKIKVSPKKLSTPEKIKRWKSIWFADVEIRDSLG